MASTAGESAQLEYERRRARDHERRRASRRTSILILLTAPVVTFVLTHLGAAVFNGYASQVTGTELVEPVFGQPTVNLLAAALAAASAMKVGAALWAPRHTTEAWAKGAEGERRTGRLLEGLAADGFVIRHDLRIPGSRANIDHVVVGPTGVFTVETKHYGREVVIRNGQALSGGRSMQRVVEQALRQAAVVRAVVGCDVTPIVCMHGGGVRLDGRRTRPVVDGVRLCSGRRLTEVLTSDAKRLDAEDVRSLAALLEGDLAQSAAWRGRRPAPRGTLP